MLIKIIDFQFDRQGEGFRLNVYSRNSSQLLGTADLSLPRSFLNEYELKQLDFDAKDPAARVDRIRNFGKKLFQQVFGADIERIWSEHKQTSEFLVLCIRIAPEVNELEAIPWETLFDGEEFIAAGTTTTVSRLPLDVEPQPTLPAVPSPLKMLAFVSSPLDLKDSSRLQMEREQEILLEAINDPAGQGRLRADFEDEAKLEILESSLETPYQIFHFTGHGMAPENGGGLLLEDVRGESRPTSVAEVLQSLQRGERSLRLVVLSGCQTARTINLGGFRDMARGILRRKIPAVIAMQFSISDKGGLKFAESFYMRIASGRALELATHAARRALLLSDDYYLQADALAPVLLTSNGDCLQTARAQAAPTVGTPQIDFSFYLPLPQLSYGFYGRRREFRQVRDGILQRNQRAVIVHGIGGIGKTALVSHIATRLKKRFQGVYAFECSSRTLTPETVLFKLNQYFVPQGMKALEQLLYQNLPPEFLANYLAQILGQWSLLLIFDNFESQLERTGEGFQIADEDLRTFIMTLVKTTATGSHFLFTSRYLFELDDKRLGTIQTLPLEDLSRPEALSLMQKLQHLAAASHREKVEALEAFGGHPYALVTLDRYCNHQPLSRALEEAKNIKAELRSFLAIELNYGQLSEPGRELIHRLAAFRRSMSHEAAEWVMGKKVSYAAEFLEANRNKMQEEWKTLDDAAILQMLENTLPERRQVEDLTRPTKELVEWGLLTPIQEDDQLKEISVHALVRDFCRDKQDTETWRERLRDAAAFYTNSTKLLDREGLSLADVFIEMEAFELLMEAEDFSEAASLLTKTTQLLDRWGFWQYLENQYRRLFDKLGPRGDATILHNFGMLVTGRGEFEKALGYLNRSLAISKDLDEGSSLVAGSLQQIGIIHKSRGEYDKALEHFELALKTREDLDDQLGVANSLAQIGTIHQRRGDYQRALEYCERSLKISQELKAPSSIAGSLHQIGRIYQDTGESDKALEYYERSLEISEELGARASIAGTLHQIGTIHSERGEYDKALENYDRSLVIFEELGDRPHIAYSLGETGNIHLARHEYEKALENYQRVLTISEELRDRFSVANSYNQIGRVFVAVARYDEAVESLLIALNIFLELQSPYVETAVRYLKKFRVEWGGENFDASWKKSTGQDVPDWLK